MCAIAVPPGAGEGDFTEPAGIEIVAFGLEVMLAGALLHAYLTDAIVDARGLDDERAFFDFEGERFFDVDIFTGIERIDGDAGVPMVGRGDEDDVDLFRFEKFAMFLIAFGAGGLGLGLVDAGIVDVAHGGDVDAVGFLESAHNTFTAAACTDEAEVDFFVGSEDAGVG